MCWVGIIARGIRPLPPYSLCAFVFQVHHPIRLLLVLSIPPVFEQRDYNVSKNGMIVIWMCLGYLHSFDWLIPASISADLILGDVFLRFHRCAGSPISYLVDLHARKWEGSGFWGLWAVFPAFHVAIHAVSISHANSADHVAHMSCFWRRAAFTFFLFLLWIQKEHDIQSNPTSRFCKMEAYQLFQCWSLFSASHMKKKNSRPPPLDRLYSQIDSLLLSQRWSQSQDSCIKIL